MVFLIVLAASTGALEAVESRARAVRRPADALRVAGDQARRVRPVTATRGEGGWLLIERSGAVLGDVIAGDQKIETSAVVARVFARGPWRLAARVSAPGGPGRLEWRTGGSARFAALPEGTAVDVARGDEATGPGGERVVIDLRLVTGPSSATGPTEFIIDLRLEEP